MRSSEALPRTPHAGVKIRKKNRHFQLTVKVFMKQLCCPLLGNDHFAVTVSLNKSNVVLAWSPKPQSVCVRDWTRLIQDQRQPIQAWATRVRYQSQRGLSASQADNKSSLNDLVRDLIDILWKAAPSHYRRKKNRTPENNLLGGQTRVLTP